MQETTELLEFCGGFLGQASVISPPVTHCVHTVDHVDAHAKQYRHVRYVRAIESDTHASRVRRARILFRHFNELHFNHDLC